MPSTEFGARQRSPQNRRSPPARKSPASTSSGLRGPSKPVRRWSGTRRRAAGSSSRNRRRRTAGTPASRPPGREGRKAARFQQLQSPRAPQLVQTMMPTTLARASRTACRRTANQWHRRGDDLDDLVRFLFDELRQQHAGQQHRQEKEQASGRSGRSGPGPWRATRTRPGLGDRQCRRPPGLARIADHQPQLCRRPPDRRERPVRCGCRQPASQNGPDRRDSGFK